MRQLYTRRNIITGFIIAAGILVLLGFYIYRNITLTLAETKKVNESLRSLRTMEDLMDDIQNIETGQRGYIISQNRLFLEPYNSGLAKLAKDTSEIRGLVRLYPSRSDRYQRLLLYVKEKVEWANRSVGLVNKGLLDSANLAIQSGRGRTLMDSIRQIVTSMEMSDRVILASANAERQVTARSSAKFLIGLVLGLLVIMVWLVRRLLKEEKIKRENEQQISYLAMLTEQSSDAIFSTNSKAIIQSWNKGAEDLFGYTKEEAIGKFTPDITRSGTTLEKMAAIAEAIPHNGNKLLEGPCYTKDGRLLHCTASITRLPGINGKEDVFVMVLRDITERKKSEKLLERFNEELAAQVKEKTKLLENIVSRIRDGFFSLDNDRRFTYVNDFAAVLMESVPEDLLGKHIWTEIPDAVQSPAFKFIEGVFTNQEPGSIEFYYPPYNKWFAAHVYPSLTGVSVFFRDISEIKKAEEDIRRSSERFDLISRTTNDAIWEWNLETGEMWGNEMHQELYGLTINDPVPDEKEWEDRLHPDDRDALIKKQEETLASDSNVFITEYRFRTNKYGYRVIYDRCYIVRNEKGEATRILGSMMDITDRKEALEKLKQSEERYRTLVENAVEALVVLDAESGKFVSVSESAADFFKLSKNELLEIGPVDLSPDFQSDGRRSEDSAKEKITKALAGEKPSFEWLHKDANGNLIQCEVRLVRLPSENNLLVRGSIIDISERKRIEQAIIDSEETRRLIMNSALDGIVCINTTGEITVWTPQAEKIFGWTEQEALGKQLTDTIIPERYREAHKKGMALYQETGHGPILNKLIEISAINKSGIEFPVELSVIPVKRRDSEFLCAFIRNITDRKKAEAALKESEEKIRHILSSSADDFYVIDKNYSVTLINATARKNLKDLWKQEVKTGTYILDIFPAERKNFIKENYDRVFKGDRVEYEFTNEINGKPFWRRVSYSPVRDETGEITGAFISTTDITEKRKAEEDIMKTNARFQVVSKATSDIVWDLNLADNKLWWNDNYYLNLGYTKRKELVDLQDWFDHIHPDDLERVKTQFLAAINGDASSWRDEYRYRKADGLYLNILDRGYIMRGDENKPYRMIGSMIDMTAIYEAQRKITESENRLRTILDTDPECIKLMDKECNLLDINKAGLRMIEADSYAEALGKNILTVVSDDQKKAAADLVTDAFAGKEGRLEFEMITLKGNKRWCEVSIVPFVNAEGKVINALGVTRDITERKLVESELIRNEEKYRTLVEQAADAIALYDESGLVLDVNTGAVKLLGYSRKELTGMYLRDILTEEEITKNPVRYDVLQKGRSTVKQRKMRRRDGTIVETEVRSQQLPDGRFLSIIRDLTERIKAEKELKESYRQLKELNSYLQNVREEERSNIAREIHDELGQQLTVLKMDISWLNKKVDTSAPAIKERLTGLLDMIDNTVKSVRRISSELRPSMLDDLGLAAAIEWHSHEFSKRSGIKIDTAIDPIDMKLPGKIAITLFRVFQESLTNVARHAEATVVEVKLKMEGNWLLLTVKDNGRGFLLKDIETRKTLGILGMKERVAIIQGRYDIQSIPGEGTTVLVSVPMNTL